MKSNSDNNLEKLMDDTMKHAGLEAPSLNFTAMVMSKVLATKSIAYKPLMPKSFFIVVLGCFCALVLYLFTNGTSPKNSWFDLSALSSIYNMQFKFSQSTVFSVVVATFMLFVQIVFLKKHFNKQSEKQMV